MTEEGRGLQVGPAMTEDGRGLRVEPAMTEGGQGIAGRARNDGRWAGDCGSSPQ